MQLLRIHIFVLASFFQFLNAQITADYSMAFYNVENLFDCRDDSLKLDNDFLPGEYKNWTPYRMYQKIDGISKVIMASNQWNPPQIIGLCEIENQHVLSQLIYHTGLNHLNYRYVHFESPDKRGIDVALLYRNTDFKILKAEPIKVTREKDHFFTRDILYVKGIMYQKDTFHIYVNHWPSKRGGALASEPKRLKAAKCLSTKLDSLQKKTSNCNIVVMGDFNAEYESESISYLTQKHHLFSMIHTNNLSFRKIPGTHKYQGHWSLIDHILIPKKLAEKFTLKHRIIQLPFLLEEDITYNGYKPNRTYLGPRYHGGISDHLPVILTIKRKGD